MALIEIDGLPINSMVIFHGYVSHNQMVYPFFLDSKITSFQVDFFSGKSTAQLSFGV